MKVRVIEPFIDKDGKTRILNEILEITKSRYNHLIKKGLVEKCIVPKEENK